MGAVSSGLAGSQFQTSAPLSVSKARITPAGSVVETLSSTVPPTISSPPATTGGEVE
jgi:hypothetical protein